MGQSYCVSGQLTDQLTIALKPYRVVVGFLLASLLWNCGAFPHVFAAYTSLRLSDDFFPAFASSPYVLAALYLIPLTLSVFALFTRGKLLLRSYAIATAACLFGLCIHQGSYNDVTFLTCFWVSLWCVWYTFRLDDPVDALAAKAKTFAMLILSLIFLGGAAGKWTQGYWSGEVLYQIYFVDRDFWFFNLLRENLAADTLRDVAVYYSRLVIVSESVCAFLWLMNPKVGSAIAIAMFLGITLFSNVHLFSVTLCLIGLAVFGLHEPKTYSQSK